MIANRRNRDDRRALTTRFKAIRAAIDRWLSDDRGADYDDLARMIEDALLESEDTTDEASPRGRNDA